MTVQDTDQLAELITKKYKCLTEIRDMGFRQRRYVEAGQMSELIKLLGAKQILINRLGQLERAMDPFRAEDPDARVWRSSEDRVKCRTISEDCDAILSEILEAERQSETTLQAQREETEKQLQGSHASTVTRQGYAESQPRAGSSQIDFTE